MGLFSLFWAQFILGALVPDGIERIAVGVVYLLLGAGIMIRDRGRMPALLRDGFRTPYSDLGEE
jgi:hypothetical protein